ncbi:MAG: hypothetical protein ACFFCE_17935 [Promethearchaeota archaeon]
MNLININLEDITESDLTYLINEGIIEKKNLEYNYVPSERFVKQEELDWINMQIVAESYRLIFTKRNDFQFVKQILKKFPELKNIERNRIFIIN